MPTFPTRSPARRDDVVRSGEPAEPDAFAGAVRVARDAQCGWAEVPAPVAREVGISCGGAALPFQPDLRIT